MAPVGFSRTRTYDSIEHIARCMVVTVSILGILLNLGHFCWHPAFSNQHMTPSALYHVLSLPTSAERVLCLDALIIAIDTTIDEAGRWYTSTNTLELVCLDLCVALRSGWNSPLRTVAVTTRTPRHLWLHGKQGVRILVPCGCRLWVCNA